MKARNIPLASKLRTLLSEVLGASKVSPGELMCHFDNVISGRDVSAKDTVVKEVGALMAQYLKQGVMSSDEMQIIVDEAIKMYRVGEGTIELPVTCGFIATGLAPNDKLEIN